MTRVLLLMLLAVCVSPLAVRSQPTPAAASWSPEPWIVDRLVTLSPADPDAYLELGEDVSSLAHDAEMVRLARELYVLAYQLSRDTEDGATTPASALLGLAELSGSEAERRWLRAVAGAVDERYLIPDWRIAAEERRPAEEALRAAETLGLARAGDGVRVRRLADDARVYAALKRVEPALAEPGSIRQVDSILREATSWPCGRCNNERVHRARVAGDVVTVLCDECGGNPGVRLSEGEFLAQLRAEAMLLGAAQSSWAADLVSERGRPLRAPDPDSIAPAFGVNPQLTVWRDGSWVEPGG